MDIFKELNIKPSKTKRKQQEWILQKKFGWKLKWCQCGKLIPGAKKENEKLICNKCNKPILCEYSYLTKHHQATKVILDYVTCDKHQHIAEKNKNARILIGYEPF